MKRQRNVNLLLMLVLLVAVGQMAQTIYIPAIADMARDLNVREGAVQSVMGAYLLTYGVSQLFYGPISDRVGRRPVILVGMSIFMLATLVAVTTSSLTVLIAASAMQGMGTGVGGVMARTLPRDLYERTQLRHANSLLNMGILVSPLLAPLIGGLLDTMWNWRACYLFLLVLCAGVTFSMARWMPETRPVDAPRTRLLTMSEEDKLVVARARKIQRFLSQPFFVAEVFTGSPGKYVSLKDTIRGFKGIMEGEYDHLPEQAFYMVGSIEEAVEKAKKL